jgi:hypothetical protein
VESSPANIGALANVEFQEEAPMLAFTNVVWRLSTDGGPYAPPAAYIVATAV